MAGVNEEKNLDEPNDHGDLIALHLNVEKWARQRPMVGVVQIAGKGDYKRVVDDAFLV